MIKFIKFLLIVKDGKWFFFYGLVLVCLKLNKDVYLLNLFWDKI